MASIGELFIQLGVLGNANELKKANAEFQKANILAQKQAKLEKLRAEYLERIQKAQTKAEKQELTRQYKAKKALIEQKAVLDIKNAEQKLLRANIAQWATYAHAVTMAANVAVNAIRKINDEVQKAASYGQNMINIGMTTSASVSELQRYGRVASALNANLSEQAVAQKLAQISQAFDLTKMGDFSQVLSMIDDSKIGLLGGRARSLYGDIIGGKVRTGSAYFERLREVIAGETPERKTNILRAFGLDENYLPMLNMGRGEFDNYASKLMRDAQTEEQLKELAEIKARLNVIKQHFDDFVMRVFSNLAPYLEDAYTVLDANLPNILSFVDGLISWVKDTFTKEDVKNFFIIMKSLWDALRPVLEYALQGWKDLLEFLADKITDKNAQDEVDQAARDKRFYDAKTNRYYGGVAGGSWATKLDDSVMTLGTRLADFFNAPESVYPQDIINKRKDFIENYSKYFDANRMTGDVNTDYKYLIQQLVIQTPEINNEQDLVTALQRLQTSY